ncbi:unnamed protein product [Discosporangium mesarthrocarpum]
MFVGVAVSWFSRTKKCVALCTSEAEYMTMGECVKELLFLQPKTGAIHLAPSKLSKEKAH